MNRLKCILSWGLVILFCMSIFYLSNEAGKVSKGRSGKVVKKVETAVCYVVSKDKNVEGKSLEYLVRKTAHVSEYLILTILVFIALKYSGVKGYKRYIGALVFTISYASLDEYHQVFVSGRDGRINDVGIDSIGVVFGCIICYIKSKVFYFNKRRLL